LIRRSKGDQVRIITWKTRMSGRCGTRSSWWSENRKKAIVINEQRE